MSQSEADCFGSCSMCLEQLFDPTTPTASAVVSLRCGHMFHSICVAQAIEHRPTCPLCRADIPPAERSVNAMFTVRPVREGHTRRIRVLRGQIRTVAERHRKMKLHRKQQRQIGQEGERCAQGQAVAAPDASAELNEQQRQQSSSSPLATESAELSPIPGAALPLGEEDPMAGIKDDEEPDLPVTGPVDPTSMSPLDAPPPPPPQDSPLLSEFALTSPLPSDAAAVPDEGAVEPAGSSGPVPAPEPRAEPPQASGNARESDDDSVVLIDSDTDSDVAIIVDSRASSVCSVAVVSPQRAPKDSGGETVDHLTLSLLSKFLAGGTMTVDAPPAKLPNTGLATPSQDQTQTPADHMKAPGSALGTPEVALSMNPKKRSRSPRSQSPSQRGQFVSSRTGADDRGSIDQENAPLGRPLDMAPTLISFDSAATAVEISGSAAFHSGNFLFSQYDDASPQRFQGLTGDAMGCGEQQDDDGDDSLPPLRFPATLEEEAALFTQMYHAKLLEDAAASTKADAECSLLIAKAEADLAMAQAENEALHRATKVISVLKNGSLFAESDKTVLKTCADAAAAMRDDAVRECQQLECELSGLERREAKIKARYRGAPLAKPSLDSTSTACPPPSSLAAETPA